MIWSQPATPQQALAAQVAADQAYMTATLATLLRAVAGISGNIYASRIGTGEPGQTFGPQDYFDAVGANGAKLCAINVATLQFIAALAAIDPPPVAPSIGPIPPDGVTLTTNPDGTVTVAGRTPLQVLQAAE